MKQKFILIAALAVGLLAAVLARVWLDGQRKELAAYKERFIGKQGGEVAIVAATRPLPQGTVIRREDLGRITGYRNLLSADNITTEDAYSLIGRKLSHPVDEKDPILWTYIDGGKERPCGLADDIMPEWRAISVPVSGASAVSGLVRPNDHVDVLGMFNLPGDAGKDDAEMVTMTVLQNVTVLATGTETGRSRETRSSGAYGMVTLQVTPREAEVLVFAQQMKGRIFLTLRNPSDTRVEEELPRVDFAQIEKELVDLNKTRQEKLKNRRR